MYCTRVAGRIDEWTADVRLRQPMPVERAAEAFPLVAANKEEVLLFLSARAVHTVNLRGLICDNGFNSPRNRGTLYGFRNERGELEGVSLIGHATLIEARSAAALEAFALVAQKHRQIHMVLGEQQLIKGFWRYYARGGQAIRLACHQVLLEKVWPATVLDPIEGLRLATLDDLNLVVAVQAKMAEQESGINPLEVDPRGFRTRCAQRIERGRDWVWINDGRLIFKATIVSETPEATYLEGIFVAPEERGHNYGSRCLSQLDRILLMKTKSVCLLVNADNEAAQALYKKSGYKFRDNYDTMFLQKRGVVA